MASIQYISNGVTCCIPLSTTQASHPSLSVYNNGTQYYAAMTTAALPGVHVCNNGINYSIGAPEEEGGVRIHSNYVCIACAYNFNTVMCVCFCTDDSDWEFELGLNPTYGTASNGWATVSWNSKNCTGTSPTIEEHFQCMCAHSTAANAITYWGTTLPACWNYVNACLAAGCDLDPKDGSSVLCTSYTLCVNDNCYWSQDTDFCYSSFNNHAAWSSCSWCKGCKPIGCWTSVDYYSYNMNRTSGIMHLWPSGTGTVCATCCMTSYVTTYCNWVQCSEDSCGVWTCCGCVTLMTIPSSTYCIEGSVPSTVYLRTPACAYGQGRGHLCNMCISVCCSNYAWSGGRTQFTVSMPSCFCNGCNSHESWPTYWHYCAETEEYSSSTIRCSCFRPNSTYELCIYDWYNLDAYVSGGRWSDGSTTWSLGGIRCVCGGLINTGWTSGSVCRCYQTCSYIDMGDVQKSWQSWLPPDIVHTAW